MLLNPFFGFVGDTAPAEGVLPSTGSVEGDPFQEILQSVQQAQEGEQSSGSGYPSLAQVIADAIAAETPQESAGSAQHPGLERPPSGHPHTGQSTPVQPEPEVPIEPGLTNGVTRVSSQTQVLPDLGSPLDLGSEMDPAIHTPTTQTEIPFTEGTKASRGDHELPTQFVELQSQFAEAPPPQTHAQPDSDFIDSNAGFAEPDSRFAESDEPSAFVQGDGERDDSETTGFQRGQDAGRQTDTRSRDQVSIGRVSGPAQSSESNDFPASVPPARMSGPASDELSSGRSTSPPILDASEPETGAIRREQGTDFLKRQLETPDAIKDARPSERAVQQSLFDLTSEGDGSVGSGFRQEERENVQPEGPVTSNRGTVSVEAARQDAGQLSLSPQSDRMEAEVAKHQVLVRELDGQPTQRIDAALNTVALPRLVEDVVTALGSQHQASSEENGELHPRVADLLRSFDPASASDEGSPNLTSTPDAPTEQSGQNAQARDGGLSSTAFKGQPQIGRSAEQPDPSSSPSTKGEAAALSQHIDSVSRELEAAKLTDPKEASGSRPATNLSEQIGTRRTEMARAALTDLPLREDVQVVHSQDGAAATHRRDPANYQTVQPEQMMEAEPQLQDLLPSARPEAPVVGNTSSPEPGLTPIGVVRGSHEAITSAPVSDAPAQVPTEVEETKVTHQIVRGARFLTREGANQVTLRLDPPELGEVTIRLSSTSKALSGEIRVENRMVQEIVNRNMANLRESLGSQGIQVDNIEVTVESGNRSSTDRDGNAAFRREQADRDGQTASDRDRRPQEREEQQDRRPRQPLGDGQVDYTA